MICPHPCGLKGKCIDPTRPSNPILFLVGEAPGADEERFGAFFVGKAGQELTNYLDRVGIPRDRVYITNVLKCRPPENRDPHKDEIEACLIHLRRELEEQKPKFIACAGRFATRTILQQDVDMEQVHGIPFRTSVWGFDTTVVPVYHPAAGLHNTFEMSLIMNDFISLKGVMMGNVKPRKDAVPGTYIWWDEPVPPPGFLPGLISVDTEEEEEKRTWTFQVCQEAGIAYVIPAHRAGVMKEIMEHPDSVLIIQNALYDLPQLWKIGIYPKKYVDTMVMAYLLQTEPQGLKALSYRHLGMRMREYLEVVYPVTQMKALSYMLRAMEYEWPDPEPVVEMVKGVPKMRQPQNVTRRIKGVLNAYAKDPDGTDLHDRWKKIAADAGRCVEDTFGPLLPGYLKDLPLQEAVDYAGCDADATWQLYPILVSKIRALGLEGTLDRDMRMLPLVAHMQANGFGTDLDKFRSLRSEFERRKEELLVDIEKVSGPINPGSAQQVSELLFKLRLKKSPKLKKGDTDLAALESIVHRHPVVKHIIDWKRYDKLIDSFIDVLLRKTDEDGRIRTKLRVTRVITGRLSSSDPNLMAQPVRTEEGRKIREGFVAQDGYTLMSADYSQIEMRVVAHISADKAMLNVFRTGKDIHTATACSMFRVPPDQIDEMKHRYPAKRVGFGILNLISAGKLMRELTLGGAEGWTEQKCQQLIYDWFGVYQGVRSWIEEQKAHARRFGYVKDMWGRIRLVPEVLSVHKQIVEAGIRQACNAPIQMGAQGIIKEAMAQLVPFVDSWNAGSRDGKPVVLPLLQIHDDLIFEVRDDVVMEVVPVIKAVMEGCVSLSVPIRADVKTGKVWAKMTKWKED